MSVMTQAGELKECRDSGGNNSMSVLTRAGELYECRD